MTQYTHRSPQTQHSAMPRRGLGMTETSNAGSGTMNKMTNFENTKEPYCDATVNFQARLAYRLSLFSLSSFISETRATVPSGCSDSLVRWHRRSPLCKPQSPAHTVLLMRTTRKAFPRWELQFTLSSPLQRQKMSVKESKELTQGFTMES